MKDDPRVTKIGKFIRETSLDEFPQFINVLKGDMSLVGPRPYLEREKEDMTYFYKYIVSCKPGVTGLWQVSGRSDVTFEDRMRMDMEYFRRNGLRVDVKILRKTSLDELPQLLNIIKGDLALIGPRPVVKDELEKYGDNASKFLSVTPGLTGNWAANGRNNTTYEDRMKLELEYVDNISFKTDIKIFFQTIYAVIKKEGAM